MKRNVKAFDMTSACEVALAHDIRIIYVPEYSDYNKAKQGIHLLNPSQRELEDALETAARDGFSKIFIHQEF